MPSTVDAQDRWAALGLGVYAAAVAAYLAHTVGPAGLIWDDGFYYLQIARNLAHGVGSTADGLHPTNGYHPLWLLSLIPVFHLTTSTMQALWVVVGLQAAGLAVSAALLYRLARHAASRWASAVAVLAWVWLSYRLALSGLEYALYVTAVLGAGCCYAERVARGAASDRTHLILGCLLAVAFLSRLDAALLAVTMAWAATRGYTAGALRTRRLMALLTPTLVAGLAYVAINLWCFGAATPVSATVKRGWSELALQQDPVYQQAGWVVAKAVHLWWPLTHESLAVRLALVGGTWIIGALWLARRRLHMDRRLDTLAPLVAYSGVSFGFYALVYHGMWSQSRWYYAVTPVLAAVLLAVSAEWGCEQVKRVGAALGGAARQRAVRVASVAALLGLVVVPVKTLRDIRALGPDFGLALAPALVAIEALPPDAVLASWNSGTLAFRSERTIVNLDGLVNSWQYQREGRQDLCEYWRRTGVTHVVDFFDFTADPPIAPVLESYRSLYGYGRCREQLRLLWADEGLPPAERLALFAFDPGRGARRGGPRRVVPTYNSKS